MRRRFGGILVAGALIAAAAMALPPASAQADEEEGAYRLVTSVSWDASHPPIAGVPVEVNYYALDQGQIRGHHDAAVHFMSGDLDLGGLPYTHEHDAIYNALTTPARVGPVGVHLGWLRAAGGDGDHQHGEGGDDYYADAMLASEARPLVPETEAALMVEGTLAAMSPSTLTFHLHDQAGEPLKGAVLATVTDAGGETLQQVKLTAHEGTASMTFLPSAWPVTVRAVAWPNLYTGPAWAPVTLQETLSPSAPDPAAVAGTAEPVPPMVCARPVTCMEPPAAGGPRIFLLTDPQPMNFVDQITRVNLITMTEDATDVLRHADMTVRITDTLGRLVFETGSIHEEDGFAQVDTRFTVPGDYRVQAWATLPDGTELAAEHWFLVLPMGPSAPQMAMVSVQAPHALEVGVPFDLVLGLHDVPSGESVPHTDYWLQALVDGVPVLDTKVHTHSGDATTRVAAPWAGEVELRIGAYPQDGGARGTFFRALTLPAEGALPDVAAPLESADTGDGDATTPGPSAAFLLAGLAGAALLAGRRRGR